METIISIEVDETIRGFIVPRPKDHVHNYKSLARLADQFFLFIDHVLTLLEIFRAWNFLAVKFSHMRKNKFRA